MSQPDSQRERGMILIVVLWLVAMMTVLVVAINAYASSSLSLATIEADGLRNRLVLESGIEAAAGMVLATPAARRVLFDGTPKAIDLGGGATVEIRIMDAAGLVDINRADKDMLLALADHLELSKASATVTDGILKWRDTVNPPPQAGAGAAAGSAVQGQNQQQQQQQQTGQQGDDGSAQPAGQQQQAQPAPGAFFALAQLYSIPGADPRDVDKFLPFIGLYSRDGKINPMAASDTVLQSIPGISPQQLAAITQARTAGRVNDPAVQHIVGQFPKFLAMSEPKAFAVAVKGLSGPHVIAGSRLAAVITFEGSGTSVYRTLAWSW